MKKQNSNLWIFLALLCALLWGSAFPGIKLGYTLFDINRQDIPSILFFAGTRFTFAGVLGFIIAFLRFDKKSFYLEKQSFFLLFVLALLQTSLQYFFFYIALTYTTGAQAAIITGSGAFVTMAMAAIIYPHERLNRKQIFAAFLGFLGILSLHINPENATELLNFSFLGTGFLLLATVMSASANILSKKIAQKVPPLLISAWQFLMGGILLLIVAKFTGGSLHAQTPKAYFLLIYLSLLSILAFAIWTYLLKTQSIASVSIFKSIIPLVGTLLSWLVLGENIFQIQKLIALILITLGVYLLNTAKTTKTK